MFFSPLEKSLQAPHQLVTLIEPDEVRLPMDHHGSLERPLLHDRLTSKDGELVIQGGSTRRMFLCHTDPDHVLSWVDEEGPYQKLLHP